MERFFSPLHCKSIASLSRLMLCRSTPKGYPAVAQQPPRLRAHGPNSQSRVKSKVRPEPRSGSPGSLSLTGLRHRPVADYGGESTGQHRPPDRLFVAIAACPCPGNAEGNASHPTSSGPTVKGVFRLHRGHRHDPSRGSQEAYDYGNRIRLANGASPVSFDPIVTKRKPVSKAPQCPRFTTSTYW